MDKRHLIFRLTALLSCAVIVWFFAMELEGGFSMPGLSAAIAIGVVGIGALLLRNRSLKIQLLAAALLCSVVTILFRVVIAEDPVRNITKQLHGSWKSIPAAGRGSGTVTLDFVDDHVVDVGISNVERCAYEITRNHELVVSDHLNKTTFQILQLHNDSLQLKMEFETLQFVRVR